MAVWPETLPQKPLARGFGLEPQDNTARFDPDVGPPQMRQRSTVATDSMDVVFRLTLAEVDILRTFWRDDLGQGSLDFDWIDPVTAEAGQFVFVGPPRYSRSGARWDVSCRLMRIA